MNDQALQLLKQIADRIGTSVQDAWGFLVFQARLEAIYDGFWAIGCVAMALVFWKIFLPKARQFKEDEDDDIGMVCIGLSYAGIIVFGILVMINLQEMTSYLVNPQFMALKYLLSNGK